MKRLIPLAALLLAPLPLAPPPLLGAASSPRYDVVIRGGTIYEGSGGAPYVGGVAVSGDRIAAVAPHVAERGATELNAHGKAVSPGFINMLAHSEENFLLDGRPLSDRVQGVTLKVMGEFSMGPLSPAMKRDMVKEQGDLCYPVTWMTLRDYLDVLSRRAIAPNVASFVGAGTVREAVLGADDV